MRENQPVPRVIAWRALVEAGLTDVPVDQLLAAQEGYGSLDARDKAFTRLLVAESLRWRGWFDHIIASYLEKPLPAKNRHAQDVLRLGLCQLLILETPPHAAVAETVELCARAGFAPMKGLVNALLRRAEREKSSLLTQRAQDSGASFVPPWLWESWKTAYGESMAGSMVNASLAEAPLDLSVKKDAAMWAETLGGECLAEDSVRLRDAGDVAKLSGYDAGAWWVQDLAASLPVRVMGEIAGRTVIDLCAAPGGKTAQLCARGAAVTAVERSASRLRLLRENMTRLAFSPRIVEADALFWKPDAPADIVLLDAPCSATGTFRRHPEALWRKKPEDVTRLIALQRRLIEAATNMVKPGGMLVYATCSLEYGEGEGQVAWIKEACPALRPSPIASAELPGMEQAVTSDGLVRALPHFFAEKGGMDGFFAARFRKNA
ncbi:MAG: MFS transporter [Alphaproteobacteria bacterium]|nr:MFS transporter [Alphaproteobacteria bacterium]